MSKTVLKNPKLSYVAYKSNKKGKRWMNRMMRRANKQIIHEEGPEAAIFKTKDEALDTWDFPSDGLPKYHTDYSYENYRKDVVSEIQSYLNGGETSIVLSDLCDFLQIEETADNLSNITDGQISDFTKAALRNIFKK